MKDNYREILFSGDEILKLIPQRPPFVFIDKFYMPLADTFFSSLTITPDNPFVKEGSMQESGLFENIAQTAAAGNGYKARVNNAEPPLGFIGAIKKSRLYNLPVSGSTIQTRVKIISELMNAMVAEGEIFQENNILLSCQLNIFLKS